MSLKEFIIILIITFVVIIFWVIFNILHAKSTIPIDSNLQSILEPVNPNFDKDIIDKLQKISLKSPPNIEVKPIATPTPQPILTIATPSAQPLESSSASGSPSGNLSQ